MFGNLVTCIVDSTAILNEPTIIFKFKGDKEINKECPNKSMETYNYVESWPSWIFFDFKQKDFFYVCNPRPHISKDGTYSYDDGGGTLKYIRKDRTLILLIPEYNWQKTFKVEYDKPNQLIKLKESQNNKILKPTSKKINNQEEILNKKQ